MLAPDLPRTSSFRGRKSHPCLVICRDKERQTGLASIYLLNAFKKGFILSNKNKGKSKLQGLRGVFGDSHSPKGTDTEGTDVKCHHCPEKCPLPSCTPKAALLAETSLS